MLCFPFLCVFMFLLLLFFSSSYMIFLVLYFEYIEWVLVFIWFSIWKTKSIKNLAINCMNCELFFISIFQVKNVQYNWNANLVQKYNIKMFLIFLGITILAIHQRIEKKTSELNKQQQRKIDSNSCLLSFISIHFMF